MQMPACAGICILAQWAGLSDRYAYQVTFKKSLPKNRFAHPFRWATGMGKWAIADMISGDKPAQFRTHLAIVNNPTLD